MRAIQTKMLSGAASLAAFRDEVLEIAAPMQLEHDPGWLAMTDHGEQARGLSLALYQNGNLVGYVPLRHRSGQLPLRVGEVTVGALPYRTLQLFGCGVLGRGEHLAEAALQGLAELPLPYDAITLETLPTESPLYRAISLGKTPGFVPIERHRAMHHVVELPPVFPEYLEQFTSKRRNGFRRAREKITAELGPLSLTIFTEAERMRALLARIGPVSTKTYQHRLFGQDLTVDNARFVRNLEAWAMRGWVRAYVLSAGDDVLAYVIGFVVGNRFHYELVGYDPNRAAYGPGSVLLLAILEDITESRVASTLDFGAGDAEYKRFFGTASWEEASVLLARRTLYARSAAGIERTFAMASRRGAEALERLGWKHKVKALLRSPSTAVHRLRTSRPAKKASSSPDILCSVREARDG